MKKLYTLVAMVLLLCNTQGQNNMSHSQFPWADFHASYNLEGEGAGIVDADEAVLDDSVMLDRALEFATTLKRSKGAFVRRVNLPQYQRVGVYNIDDGGYVIVNGDCRGNAILAYSPSGHIVLSHLSPEFSMMLESYDNQMLNYDHAAASRAQEAPVTVEGSDAKSFPESVHPLVQTHWSQSSLYSTMTPVDPYTNTHLTPGCVAVAAAQVLRYWSYPYMGYGERCYSYENLYPCWHFDTLCANFGRTYYNYAQMPTRLDSTSSQAQSDAVNQLLYHVGVAFNMNYGINCDSESGADMVWSGLRLHKYFHYRDGFENLSCPTGYAVNTFMLRLKQELAASRPILYSMASVSTIYGDYWGLSGESHAIVVDGYDANDMLHINWGWGDDPNNSVLDGYFRISAIGNTASLTSFAVVGIQPPAEPFGLAIPTSDFTVQKKRVLQGDTIRGHYAMTNNGDCPVTANFAVVAKRSWDDTTGLCIHSRTVTLQRYQNISVDFSYPVTLGFGQYELQLVNTEQPLTVGDTAARCERPVDVDHSLTQMIEVQVPNPPEWSNLVLFVRFQDDDRTMFHGKTYYAMLLNSVADFVRQNSYGKLRWTFQAPQLNGECVLHYADPYPRGYYRPYSESNPIGYRPDDTLTGREYREAQMLASLASYVNASYSFRLLDKNGDGRIDNTIVVITENDDSGILGMHSGRLMSNRYGIRAVVDSTYIDDYCVFMERAAHLNEYNVAHEAFRNLGFEDRMGTDGIQPVGHYDLMGGGMCHVSAISKYQHGWIDTVIRLQHNGTYTIRSNGSSGMRSLYYVNSRRDTNVWYTLEYRNADDDGETSLTKSGMLMGRWDNDADSCGYWIFRPNSSDSHQQGSLDEAMFGDVLGRPVFGPNTNPCPHLADGTPENEFEVTDIQVHGDSCTFTFRFLYADIDSAAPGGIRANAGLRIVPNPASSRVCICFDNPSHSPVSVTVVNAVGRKVWQRNYDKGEWSDRGLTMSVEKLPKGVYFVLISTDGESYSGKLVVR